MLYLFILNPGQIRGITVFSRHCSCQGACKAYLMSKGGPYPTLAFSEKVI